MAALEAIIQYIFVSPEFVLIVERGEPGNNNPTSRPLTDFEIATRMALFLARINNPPFPAVPVRVKSTMFCEHNFGPGDKRGQNTINVRCVLVTVNDIDIFCSNDFSNRLDQFDIKSRVSVKYMEPSAGLLQLLSDWADLSFDANNRIFE